MHIDNLLDNLTKPMYVWRMARACPTKPGSEKRMDNARLEAIQLITNYWEHITSDTVEINIRMNTNEYE